jgi:hypothetical protein
MVMLANIAALLLLSLIPDHGGRQADPHGLQRLVRDDAFRQLLLAGRFGEYSSALDDALTSRVAAELRAKRQPVSSAALRDALLGGADSDLKTLFAAVKGAIAVATLASELHALGPAMAMRTALHWVESGLIRRSGLRAADFGSFYRIVSRPGRASLEAAEERALAEETANSEERMNKGFGQLVARLTESFI